MKVVTLTVVCLGVWVAAAAADPDGSYHLDSRGVQVQLGLTPPHQLLETHRVASQAYQRNSDAAGSSATQMAPRDSNSQYAWAYEVAAPSSGDRKAAREERRGNVVVGQYSLIDPNGSFRVVDYFVRPETGFRATISTDEDPAALAQQAAVQYSAQSDNQPQPVAGHQNHDQRIQQAIRDHFKTPQLRDQFQSPHIEAHVDTPFSKAHLQSSPIRDNFHSFKVEDHFQTPQLRRQFQRPQVKDNFQSQQIMDFRDHFRTPQIKDQFRTPQIKDHFRTPQIQDQFQSPQLTDDFQNPQLQDQFQNPRFKDYFQSQQLKDQSQNPQFRARFQSPQFMDHFQNPNVKFQMPRMQVHHFKEQILSQTNPTFQFQNPHFSRHQFLMPQPQRLQSMHFRDHFIKPHVRNTFTTHPLHIQQIHEGQFNHPYFSKHQFLRQEVNHGQLQKQNLMKNPQDQQITNDKLPNQESSTDSIQPQETGDKIVDDSLIKDEIRTKPTKKDPFPDHSVDEQTKKENIQKPEVHGDLFHDQQVKTDPLHETQDGASQPQNQNINNDQVLRQFNEGVFQNPQSRFYNEKIASRTFLIENLNKGQQQQQQQRGGQQGSLSPALLSSAPASGVTLKKAVSVVDNQRRAQGLGQPPHLAAASPLIHDRSHRISTSPQGQRHDSGRFS